MTKSIKIWRNKLEISKEGTNYMLNNKKVDLFMHADKLLLGTQSTVHGWLTLFNDDNTYIGSLWISTDTDMKKVKKFLEETK